MKHSRKHATEFHSDTDVKAGPEGINPLSHPSQSTDRVDSPCHAISQHARNARIIPRKILTFSPTQNFHCWQILDYVLKCTHFLFLLPFLRPSFILSVMYSQGISNNPYPLLNQLNAIYFFKIHSTTLLSSTSRFS